MQVYEDATLTVVVDENVEESIIETESTTSHELFGVPIETETDLFGLSVIWLLLIIGAVAIGSAIGGSLGGGGFYDSDRMY